MDTGDDSIFNIDISNGEPANCEYVILSHARAASLTRWVSCARQG